MSRYILTVLIVVLVVIVLSALVASRDCSKKGTGGEETKGASPGLPTMISKSGGVDVATSQKTIGDVVKGMRTVDDYFITAQMLAQVEKTFEGRVPTQKEQEDFVDSIMIQKKKFMAGTNQIEFRLLSREALLTILFPKK